MSSSTPQLNSARSFLSFVNKAQSPWHAVQVSREKLIAGGFTELNERDTWSVKPNGKYFFTRNQSTLVAFAVGGKFKAGNGFTMVGAHTDSPCLRVKPVSAMPSKHGYIQIGVETYGGGLWHTWFDRDLTLCGRVVILGENGYESRLLKVDRPIISIPNLAIHLNRSIYEDGFKPNHETHLVPLIATTLKSMLEGYKVPEHACSSTEMENMHHPLLIQLICEELKVSPSQIVDFELCLADCVPSCLAGIHNEFIHSGRLDNLLSSYSAVEALIRSLPTLGNDSNCRIVSLYDHEEIGSSSAQGAASAMTEHVLRRLSVNIKNPVAFEEAMNRSLLISADMAHAVHPNYPEKHESQHAVQMHRGPVIKYNCKQRYATNSVTSSVIREIARRHNIPLQSFVVRNDSGCGSTIGPILSSNLGLRVVDIGNPQLAMHSIREMCGVDDLYNCIQLMEAFFSDFPELDTKFKIDGKGC
eukprot:Sdes_comp18390_c0_seq1m8217